MTAPPILTSLEDKVFTLTLNRPERMNALSIELMQGASAALDDAVAQGAKALVLTGAGRGFCSGADLQSDASQSGKADMGLGLEMGVNPLLERLFSLPIPVITAVNGPAVGAGAGLAICGDFALMARTSYLLLAFVNVGLVPDAGLTFLLPRLAGRQRALEMMMLGERISAEQADSWGLIYKVVDDEALLDEATRLARRLAAGPTKSYALIRRTLRRSLDASFTETLHMEREAQREAGYSEDFAEGVAAFKEKRKPAFQGR